MPGVIRTPRNSIRDRPGRLCLLYRRLRRLARPVAAGTVVFIALLLVVAFSGGRVPIATVASLRSDFGAVAAIAGSRVRSVIIEGRGNTPESMLNAALEVKKGDPILSFSVAAARARIERLSWVGVATVERRLPGKILVSLQERRPFAVWQHEGRFVVIDRNGQVVSNEDAVQFDSLPLVVGAGASLAAPALIDALNDRPLLFARVLAATRVGQRRWDLELKGGTHIMLPEGAEAAALDRLERLQENYGLLDRSLQVIDLRLPDRLMLRSVPNPNADNGTAPVRKSYVTRKPT
jgi:cell division protein FtsQ